MQGNMSGCCAAAALSSSTHHRRHHASLHLATSMSSNGTACILLEAVRLWDSGLAVECAAHLTQHLCTTRPLSVAHWGSVMQAVCTYISIT